jgi:2-dehydro-3-deoxygalactonokinase
LIAVDWGTSSFRAFRVAHDGSILDRRASDQGILNVKDRDFAAFLQTEVTPWLEQGEKYILLSGMIGSRQGWVEARYLPCPAGIIELAKSVTLVSCTYAKVGIVPGVSALDINKTPEVMRGEETEAFGMVGTSKGRELICVPGIHSKWIEATNQQITNFNTCMTGEVYAALSSGTILSRMMTKKLATDDSAFLRGTARSAEPGGMLHHLFGIRSLTLFNQLNQDSAASYLSGLLIGHEVRSLMPTDAEVHLLGTKSLCDLYTKAIRFYGGSVLSKTVDAAPRGLAAIGRILNWM